jgi:hypothetical protein
MLFIVGSVQIKKKNVIIVIVFNDFFTAFKP